MHSNIIIVKLSCLESKTFQWVLYTTLFKLIEQIRDQVISKQENFDEELVNICYKFPRSISQSFFIRILSKLDPFRVAFVFTASEQLIRLDSKKGILLPFLTKIHEWTCGKACLFMISTQPWDSYKGTSRLIRFKPLIILFPQYTSGIFICCVLLIKKNN